MRFEHLKVRNMGTFGEVDVDLAAITGQLIAVTGENGAGKSTLLELLRGAIDRQCATRGTLGELATARDAMAEVRVVNGKAITVRQTVDCISKKGETLILDEQGQPVTSSGKVSEGDEWLAKHVLSPDVHYASAFSAQASGGFVALKPSERKAVLLRVLQIERLERLAELARKRAATARTEAEQLRARIADEEARTPDLDKARADVERLEGVAHEAAESAARARKALETAKAAAADAAKAAEVRAQRRQLEQKRVQLRNAITETAERITNNRRLLERETEVRDAVARLPGLGLELTAVNERLTTIEGEIAKARAEHAAAAGEQRRAVEQHAKAETRAKSARRRLDDRAIVEHAVKMVETLRTLQTEAEAERAGAAARLDALQERLRGMAERRIDGLRSALSGVLLESEMEAAQECAEQGLEADNTAMREQAEGPVVLADAKSAVNAAEAKLALTRRQLEQHERDAARAGEMAAAAAELEQAETDATTARGAITESNRAMRETDETMAVHVADRDRARLERERIERDQQTDGALAALLPKLEAATARIESLTAESDRLTGEVAEVGRALDALPEVGETGSVDLAALERAAAEAEHGEHAARDSVGKARARVEQAEQGRARLLALNAALLTLQAQLADWTRLAQDLGRDGLQAMEIDAAVPEINEIANSLLHGCFGSRFTVTLSTQRLDAKGQREIETLEIRVIDTEKGRDANIESLSGGEKVIVAEAVSLALTTLACRRAGLEGPSIIRDETGAAVSKRYRPAYAKMLRLAARDIGARHVLFVSHHQDLTELADAVLHVEGGTVEVIA